MIVVTTPTGQIGHQVLDHVLGGGEPIRVIARDPSRLSPQARERVEVVQGSMTDIDVVTEAFTGADSVFWLLPPTPDDERFVGHWLDFIRPLCEAIEREGVERVVGISSLGRGEARNAGPVSAALGQDHLIESTGVNYRALCMPFFMENLLGQVEPITSQGIFSATNAAERTLLTIATRDIAATAAELLLNDSWSGQDSVPVIGPDDLSPNDMAQVMSEVLQRPVRYQQVTPADYRTTLMQDGMSQAWAQAMSNMARAAENQPAVFSTVEPGISRSSTSFRQWCEDVLKPAVLA